jgi:hypothetical protein
MDRMAPHEHAATNVGGRVARDPRAAGSRGRRTMPRAVGFGRFGRPPAETEPGSSDRHSRVVRGRDRGSLPASVQVHTQAAFTRGAEEPVRAKRPEGGRIVNRSRLILAVSLLVFAWVCMAPALAAADVAVPPSQSPSTLPTPSPTSASPTALPAAPASGPGGGTLAATVGGGIAVVALGAGSWLILRRAATRRSASQAPAATATGDAGAAEEPD